MDGLLDNKGVCYNKFMDHEIQKTPVIGETEINENAEKDQRLMMAGIIVVGILLLAALVGTVYFLLQDSQRTELIRDMMVVLLAIEMLFIGLSAVLLILQVTRLANLLQNEIKPLLESANETIYTLRGTATFISDSFVQPVIKFNSYLAGAKKILDLINFNKK